MKKILLVTACAVSLTVAPAFANKMEGKGDHYFQKIDTNNDGKISKSEHDSHSRKMFNKIDANDDNRITREELTAYKEKEWGEQRAMKEEYRGMRGDRDDRYSPAAGGTRSTIDNPNNKDLKPGN